MEFSRVILSFLLYSLVITDEMTYLEPKSIGKTLSVVNLEFCQSCLSAEEKEGKETYKEVLNYAELKHDPRANLPSSFTICSSAMRTYGGDQMFFNILGKDGNSWLQPILWNRNEKTTFFHRNWADVKLPPVFAYQWVRSCMAINSDSGLLQWVVDGILVEDTTVDVLRDTKANMPLDLTGKIVLGAYQSVSTKKWRNFWPNQVTNLNIFSTALEIEAMVENTKSTKCILDGDYLAWKDMQWTVNGKARIEYANVKEVCKTHPSFNLVLYPVIFPSLKFCSQFCQKLLSRIFPSTTLQEIDYIQKYADGLRKPKNIWLALDDSDSEGEWSDFYDRKAVNFSLPWIEGEPNGGISENCVALKSPIGVMDVRCDDSYCFCPCDRTQVPYLRLRGLCSQSTIRDTLYQFLTNSTDIERLALVGLHNWIEFDQKTMQWLLTDTESNVTAVSRAAHISFLLGRHNWTVRGDKGCSEEGREYTTELKMSGCQEGSFTCNDGQCVSMKLRCNQLPDCRDKSDEEGCKVLVLGKSYNKNVPPVISGGEKLNVSISLSILRVVDIKEEDYSIAIQFSITLKWRENRAKYHNLKHQKDLNALTQHEISTLWLPKVIYENTDQRDTTRLGEYGNGEWDTNILVDRQGTPTSSEINIVDESEIFDGSENNLTMSQTYTRDFQCNYDFVMYPFDTQV